jgi:hypothetical protein
VLILRGFDTEAGSTCGRGDLPGHGMPRLWPHLLPHLPQLLRQRPQVPRLRPVETRASHASGTLDDGLSADGAFSLPPAIVGVAINRRGGCWVGIGSGPEAGGRQVRPAASLGRDRDPSASCPPRTGSVCGEDSAGPIVMDNGTQVTTSVRRALGVEMTVCGGVESKTGPSGCHQGPLWAHRPCTRGSGSGGQ